MDKSIKLQKFFLYEWFPFQAVESQVVYAPQTPAGQASIQIYKQQIVCAGTFLQANTRLQQKSRNRLEAGETSQPRYSMTSRTEYFQIIMVNKRVECSPEWRRIVCVLLSCYGLTNKLNIQKVFISLTSFCFCNDLKYPEYLRKNVLPHKMAVGDGW